MLAIAAGLEVESSLFFIACFAFDSPLKDKQCVIF